MNAPRYLLPLASSTAATTPRVIYADSGRAPLALDRRAA